MRILAIESSCDDTSVALVDCSDSGFFVLSEKTASQIEVHKKYGGVVPEVAGRQHAENIVPVIEEVSGSQRSNAKGQMPPTMPDAIAVTAGPGLITGLVVGVEAAKALSYLWNTPLIAVNHIAGHAHSVQIVNQTSPTLSTESVSPSAHRTDFKLRSGGKGQKSEVRQTGVQIEYPALALIVSGGHTELLLMKDPTNFKLIGKTRDDAAGEAFDKVGKLLDFEYPGGPKISKFASAGNPDTIKFPRPMLDEDNFDFSFAGLKTAALYWLRDNKLSAMKVNPINLPAGIFGTVPEGPTIHDFCASFEQAIVDTLVTKTIRAATQHKPKTIILGGGVSANQKLRHALEEAIHPMKSELLIPNLKYAMDNAAMIAVAGYYKALNNEYTNWKDIEANPNWRVYI